MLDTNEKFKNILSDEKKNKAKDKESKQALAHGINIIVSAAQLVLLYFGYNSIAGKFNYPVFTPVEYALAIGGGLSFLTLIRNYIKGFYTKYD